MDTYERGAEWRKWDLHIHTPETAKNNQYGSSDQDWLNFVEKLEQTDIAVFGITDYFSIDNYYKLKEYQNQGRLSRKTLLPNVELRIEPVTGSGTPINIHVIFDPTLTKSEISREFFSEIKFEYSNSNYSCTNENLIELGRIIQGDKLYPEKSAINKAISVMTISYSTLRDIIRKPFFKSRLIIATSNSSKDGMSGLLKQPGTMSATRQEICKMSDIILSGNENDVSFFLGEKTSIKDVVECYGGLKPCVTGSDAHSIENVGHFINGRITWIKADPSFEGLKQILFEPKERVRISEIKPDEKFDYNVIDHVELNAAGIWHQVIPFNQNLNTIIGGRSTGKSTLLASIANKFKDLNSLENSSFINSLSDNVRVVWRDEQENNNKDIEYFPQNYISNIANTEYTDKLLLQILLDNEDKKIEYDTYQAKLAAQYSDIQSKVTLYFEKRRLYFEKSREIKSIGDIEGIKREILKYQTLQNQIQSTILVKKEELAAFKEQDCKLLALKKEETELENEIKNLNILSKEHFIIKNNVSLLRLSEKSNETISKIIEQQLVESNSIIHETILNICKIDQAANLEIKDKILNIQNDVTYKSGKQVFDANKSMAEITKNLNSLNLKLSQITKATEYALEIRKEYKQIGKELLALHIKYLDIMNDIASCMRMKHEEVTLTSEIILKDSLEKTLNECISLRSNAMNELIQKVITTFKTKIKADVQDCILDLLNSALKNKLIFKGGYDSHSFMSKLLSECWYGLKLNVEYDGDSLQDMSPGKRSFVVLKLLLDFSDKKCPILIDQPEDNLDNRAIYNELVKYIRRKKRERQIILVTHNPNIVVGADTEEVIIANQNGKNSPNSDNIKFQYFTGSLECSNNRSSDISIPILQRCGIREHVCDILEGGENAFRDRENKYGFFTVK